MKETLTIPWRELPAGEDLDAVVAQALGLDRHEYKRMVPCPDGKPGCCVAHYRVEWPAFSRSTAGSLALVELLNARGYDVTLHMPAKRRDNTAEVARPEWAGSVVHTETTMPLALVLATLEALESEVPG